MLYSTKPIEIIGYDNEAQNSVRIQIIQGSDDDAQAAYAELLYPRTSSDRWFYTLGVSKYRHSYKTIPLLNNKQAGFLLNEGIAYGARARAT